MDQAGKIVADAGTRTYRTRDGDEIEIPAYLAEAFAAIDERRARERLAYCQRHGLEPETFTGCYACEGTGRDLRTNDPCFCAYGSTIQRQIDQREEREFRARLARLNGTKGIE